jgi:hypothetical protein
VNRFRLILAWTLLGASLIGWPIAALTFAKDEPQFVLGLSFLALAYESFNSVQIASDAKKAG